jgi:pyruvyl transferase EpsO
LGIVPVYECSARTYDRAAMAAALGGGTILLHGGGIFGDRFPEQHEFRMRVLEDFPENAAILLPQQITFFDTEYLQRSVTRLAARKGLTISARAVVAEHMFERYFGRLCARRAGARHGLHAGPQQRPREALVDIVWVARTDSGAHREQTEAAQDSPRRRPRSLLCRRSMTASRSMPW